MEHNFSSLRKEAESILQKNIKRDIASVIPAEVTSGAKDGASGGTLSARPDQLNRQVGSQLPPVLKPDAPVTSEPLPQKFENPMVGNKANLSQDAKIIKDKAEEHRNVLKDNIPLENQLHYVNKSSRGSTMKVIKKKTNTKMSEKTPKQAKKYDDCVEDVKAKGEDVNAYAV